MKLPSKKKRSSGSTLTDLIMFKTRWWQHLVFWGAVLVILFNVFKVSGSVQKIDVIYTFIFILPIIVVVYLNLYMAIPRFLSKERYLCYVLIFMVLLAGGALFLYLLFDRWIDLLLPGFYFISYYNVPILMLYIGSIMVLTTLLKLSRSWFMLLRVERITTTHQLQTLQSQINPHFLLNSLQTIYALSLEKSERSPEVILQLSDILKYTLYETGQPTVELEKEIAMIRDYVGMYRHRVDPEHTTISMEISGDPEGLMIAPMLLIPFIENSFKHRLRGEQQRAYIAIDLEIEEDEIRFRIENSRGENDQPDLEQQKGIGIENTRQRLELLYHGKHTLDIEINEVAFIVKLSIKASRK